MEKLMTQGKIFYARHDGLYVLKFVGGMHHTQDWSFETSASLTAFLDRIFSENDFDHILIDLTSATSIDSTNLGILARIAQFMREHGKQKPTIVSTNPHVNLTLDLIGFSQIFNIVHDKNQAAEATAKLVEPGAENVNIRHVLLEAHQLLSEISEENAERFKPIIETLEEEFPSCE